MRTKLLGIVKYALKEFGPLLAFWALAPTLGLKPAIAGTLVVIVADALWRRYAREPFTRLYLLVSALTLGFGAFDLCVATPFLLKYEAPITNIVTGIAFVLGAMGERPILQEVAEQRVGALPATQQVTRFFRLFTFVWAGYFFLKAAAYLYIAAVMPLMQAMALRSVGGSISLALMVALSVTKGRRLFMLARRFGWLGETEPAQA